MVGNTGFEPVTFRTSSGYSPAELIAHDYGIITQSVAFGQPVITVFSGHYGLLVGFVL